MCGADRLLQLWCTYTRPFKLGRGLTKGDPGFECPRRALPELRGTAVVAFRSPQCRLRSPSSAQLLDLPAVVLQEQAKILGAVGDNQVFAGRSFLEVVHAILVEQPDRYREFS